MTPNKLFVLFMATWIFLACTRCTKEIVLSRDEKNALSAVVNHYDNHVVDFTKKVSSRDGEELQYVLDITSLDMKQYHNQSNTCGLLSTWLFMSALKDEGEDVDKITVKYIFEGKTYNFESDLDFSRLACSFNPRLAEIDSFFRTSNYEALGRLMSPTAISENEKKSFLELLHQKDEQKGKVEQQIVTGISGKRPEEGSTKVWVMFRANHKRGQQFHPIEINFDPAEANTPIIGFTFR